MDSSDQKHITVVLHENLMLRDAEIRYSQFRVTAILNFVHSSHQGAPLCLRWFFENVTAIPPR